MVIELINIYGLEVVQAYMKHIQDNAEVAVRELLRTVGEELIEDTQDSSITAADFMDDGSEVKLKLEVDEVRGEAVFDFT